MKFFYLISLSALLLSCQPKTVEKNGGLIIDLDIINNSTNESQIDSALDILRKRVESLYNNNPQVILSSDKKSIQIKLPLAADSIFVKNFIIRKGDFKTVETYEIKEIFKCLEDINNKLVENQNYRSQLPVDTASDSGKSELRQNLAEVEKVKENKLPLFSILVPSLTGDGSLGNGPVMGISKISDTAVVGSILSDKNLIGLLPDNLNCKWSRYNRNDDYLWLIATKKPMNQNIITSDMIADARTTKNEYTDQDEVSFSLKPEYNHVWGDMTRNNINRSLAILIDDDVFTYPKVASEITNGHSTVGGQTSTEQAKALVAILKYGPIPVDIKLKKITKI